MARKPAPDDNTKDGMKDGMKDGIELHSIVPRAPQFINDGRQHDRSRHEWKEYLDLKGKCWKCVLCGACTRTAPPPSPDPEGWYPDMGYEKLTDAERALSPYNTQKL